MSIDPYEGTYSQGWSENQLRDLIKEVKIFDVYQGDGVEKGKKSIALGLTWQDPSRTLSDDEINTTIIRCVKALREQFNAKLRD